MPHTRPWSYDNEYMFSGTRRDGVGGLNEQVTRAL